MMILQAGGTTTILPNPQFSDSEGQTSEVQIVRAIDGTKRTYIKTKLGRRKLQWAFRLTRPKALELQAFYKTYFADTVTITDHNERVWVGNFMNNPFELDSASRAKPNIQSLRGETVTVNLEFEGIEQ